MEYRFTLQKYKVGSKITCPKCGKPKSFVRYMDNEGKIEFPEFVGRCDHEDRCGYHYTPKDYFNDNPDVSHQMIKDSRDKCQSLPPKASIEIKPSYMNNSLVTSSQKCYDRNNLFLFLNQRFGIKETERLFNMYRVGTSRYWNGSTVFWQIDCQNRVHAGKIFLYNKENGHRVKDGGSKISWVHSVMGLKDFNLNQCLFGEHLISQYSIAPIAIVESEKTAIIATHYMPEYIWLATGGKDGCFNSRAIQILNGREVMLVPDLKATEQWVQKSLLLKDVCKKVTVCKVLEEIATPEQYEEGLDVADYLLEEDSDENILASMISRNPSLQNLIDAFDLQLISVERQ